MEMMSTLEFYCDLKNLSENSDDMLRASAAAGTTRTTKILSG